jgi:hypothetical protein
MDGHGRNACVSLEVDADRYFEEWSQKVDVLRTPKDESWGARTFDLLDPFGNTIFVMGPIRSTRGDAEARRREGHGRAGAGLSAALCRPAQGRVRQSARLIPPLWRKLLNNPG